MRYESLQSGFGRIFPEARQPDRYKPLKNQIMAGPWQLLILLTLILTIVAIVRLIGLTTEWIDKVLRAMLILVFPLAGSLIFFVWRNRLIKAGSQNKIQEKQPVK